MRTSWPRAEMRSAQRCTSLPINGAVLALAWAEYFGRIPWQFMVTLTFDPKRVYPVGQQRAQKEAERWCQDVERALRSRVGWLLATERGRSGQWHAHVLMTGVGRSLDVF